MAIESGNNHAKDIKVDRLPHGQSLSAEQRGGIQGLEGAAAGVTEHQIFAPDMPAGPQVESTMRVPHYRHFPGSTPAEQRASRDAYLQGRANAAKAQGQEIVF